MKLLRELCSRCNDVQQNSTIHRKGKNDGIFDKLGETIVNVGKDATQKAKDLSGVAKLNLDIKAKEDYVQRQYTELGRIYYEEHKTESEVDGAEHFELIKEALEEIERMKLEIMELREPKPVQNAEQSLLTEQNSVVPAHEKVSVVVDTDPEAEDVTVEEVSEEEKKEEL